MIYPSDFEAKSGFDEVRAMLRERCLCSLGRDRADAVAFLTDTAAVNTLLRQTAELRSIVADGYDFPLHYFFDMRSALARTRIEGTHMEEDELFDLRRSLATIGDIVRFTAVTGDDDKPRYPSLHDMSRHIAPPTGIIRAIDAVLDHHGKIKDSASPHLAETRADLARTAGSISRTLNAILRAAQTEGYVDKDAAPTMRDGRLVIPVSPAMKRKIRGIVHDESASGKTVFIEPAEAVEANNRIRELEAEERREVVRILVETVKAVRPHIDALLAAYDFLADIDLLQAKAALADAMHAADITAVEAEPLVDWAEAYHPLLRFSLEKQGKTAVPLDIVLRNEESPSANEERRMKNEESPSANEERRMKNEEYSFAGASSSDDDGSSLSIKEKKGGRMLIISGPNAGGKSVCLRTVALLQYMIQSGMPVPASPASRFGTFETLMIDMGDGQSIENDLSTYSSHLAAMKAMLRHAGERSLLLIDEFGSGTEPQIGGAIAQAVLRQLCDKGAFGVVTTHYQNLKHFADSRDGVVNGAMLYDRHAMAPLFRLAIGQPGSSFAIDMARKTGLPESVIADAADLAGSEYIQSDKYLQDIVRDKRYWEQKRQSIRRREKEMEQLAARYEHDIEEIENSRKEILRGAREQAEELLQQTNRTIERTIREIRESQAEREETKRLRHALDVFKGEVAAADEPPNDDLVEKKMRQLQERKARREQRKADKAAKEALSADETNRNTARNDKKRAAKASETPIEKGAIVRMRGTQTVGTVTSLQGDSAFVVFGAMRTKVPVERLERAEAQQLQEQKAPTGYSRSTREAIDERRERFRHDLDVRGMRGDEALTAVTYFVDDAILLGIGRVRILHGKGNGILRQLIRDYLSGVPNVTSCRDEHVQFGGAGITVVDL